MKFAQITMNAITTAGFDVFTLQVWPKVMGNLSYPKVLSSCVISNTVWTSRYVLVVDMKSATHSLQAVWEHLSRVHFKFNCHK